MERCLVTIKDWQMRNSTRSSDDLATRLLAGPAPDPDSTFEGFQASPVSAIAVAAVRLTASSSGRPATYSPVFIRGPKGSGKTRLLNALANELRANDVDFIYLDGVELKKAPREASLEICRRLHDALRAARVAMVDNVQNLAGAPCRDEVIAALAGMAATRRHVVLAADRPLSRIIGFPQPPERSLGTGLELVMDRWIPQKQSGPSNAAMLNGISRFYRVPVPVLKGIRRTADVLHARHVGMYVMYNDKRQHLSLPDIGRLFGDRDHTTVLHGVRKIEYLVATDRGLAAEIKALRRALGLLSVA